MNFSKYPNIQGNKFYVILRVFGVYHLYNGMPCSTYRGQDGLVVPQSSVPNF